MARRLSRDDWVDAAFAALAEGGIDAVRIGRLCRALGVTKGSFYWHFRGREDLLDAVAGAWGGGVPARAREQLDAAEGNPSELLVRVTRLLGELDIGRRDHAMRAWAASDPRAARAVERADGRLLPFVEDLLRRTGLAPRDVFALSRVLIYTAIGHYAAPQLVDDAGRRRVTRRLLELIGELGASAERLRAS